MAYNPDFTGRLPKDTFPGILNSDGINIYNSTGSKLDFFNITASHAADAINSFFAETASYVRSASIVTNVTNVLFNSSSISSSWASSSLTASYVENKAGANPMFILDKVSSASARINNSQWVFSPSIVSAFTGSILGTASWARNTSTSSISINSQTSAFASQLTIQDGTYNSQVGFITFADGTGQQSVYNSTDFYYTPDTQYLSVPYITSNRLYGSSSFALVSDVTNEASTGTGKIVRESGPVMNGFQVVGASTPTNLSITLIGQSTASYVSVGSLYGTRVYSYRTIAGVKTYSSTPIELVVTDTDTITLGNRYFARISFTGSNLAEGYKLIKYAIYGGVIWTREADIGTLTTIDDNNNIWTSSVTITPSTTAATNFETKVRVTGSLDVRGSIIGDLTGTSSWAINSKTASIVTEPSSGTGTLVRATSPQLTDVNITNGANIDTLTINNVSITGPDEYSIQFENEFEETPIVLNIPARLLNATSSWAISASWAPPQDLALIEGETYNITASWSVNGVSAISCSWASKSLNSDYARSASWASSSYTSSLLLGTATGSILNGVSFKGTASWAESCSYAKTASVALTASYVENIINNAYYYFQANDFTTNLIYLHPFQQVNYHEVGRISSVSPNYIYSFNGSGTVVGKTDLIQEYRQSTVRHLAQLTSSNVGVYPEWGTTNVDSPESNMTLYFVGTFPPDAFSFLAYGDGNEIVIGLASDDPFTGSANWVGTIFGTPLPTL